VTGSDYADIRINADRLREDFAELCEIGATIHGGVSRLALSNEDLQARAWLDRRFQHSGIEVRDDDAGNLSGILRSENPDARTLILGSHLDTVPDGGCYDGSVGVLAALEVLRTIRDAGITLPVHLEAIDFTDEEGCWHPNLGSGALTGTLTENYNSDRDRDYGPFRAALYRAGIPPNNIHKARRDPATLAGYLELHIEQSQRLFEAGCDIGVITNIAGRSSYQMEFRGEACHSGTTAMENRQDALLGASTYIVEAHRLIRECFPGGMFNCENLAVSPGTFNMIPDRANVVWDCRHIDKEQMEIMEGRLLELAKEQATVHSLDVWVKRLVRTSVATMAGRAVLEIERVCERLGVSSMRMASYAGHDAQIMSTFTPSGMIFIPSVGGISHTSREFTEWRHVIQGANVLLHSALGIATEVG
jgi:N-carbamoyl-L-amino-acid hydrolase